MTLFVFYLAWNENGTMDIFSREEKRIGILVIFDRWMLIVAFFFSCARSSGHFFIFIVIYLLLPFLISHCSVMSILTWFLAEIE